MKKNPVVSIITPCYNGEKYLDNYLQSVLAQDYAPIELVFVNDGSTDRTEQIALSYEERFLEKGITLRYFYQPNAGQAAAINRGLKVFTGEYMMWMDADDILYPTHVSEKVAYLQAHPECGFVLVQGESVRADTPDVRISVLKREKPEGKDTYFRDLLFHRNVVFCPATIMVRREAFETAIPSGAIFESTQGQNWQLMLPIAYVYQGGYIEKVLFKYVVHSDSHSNQKRNFEQWRERYDGFEKLQITTINRIVQMSEDKKRKWTHWIRVETMIKHLENDYRYMKFAQMKRDRMELKSLGYKLDWQDSFVFYWIKKVNQVLKRKLAGK